jgi:hypothetical protein
MLISFSFMDPKIVMKICRIGHHGPIPWPPISPDLLGFFLLGLMKEITYRIKVRMRGGGGTPASDL